MSTRFKSICYRAWIALSVLWVAFSLLFVGGDAVDHFLHDQPPYATSWIWLLGIVLAFTFGPPLALRWLGRTVVWIAGDRP